MLLDNRSSTKGVWTVKTITINWGQNNSTQIYRARHH